MRSGRVSATGRIAATGYRLYVYDEATDQLRSRSDAVERVKGIEPTAQLIHE
jgi:hypothetical protein